jgi:hypothetical protein
MIGGQRTDVELRYVVDTSEAADAARTWAHGGKFRPRRVGASLTPRPWKGRPSGHQRKAFWSSVLAGCLVRRLSLHSGKGVGPGSA